MQNNKPKSNVSEEEIRCIVDLAMNGIYSVLQHKIGIEDGGIAGIIHSGDGEKLEDQLVEHFKKYVAAELGQS